MNQPTLPRVLYCAPEDTLYKKLCKQASGFVMEARSVHFQGTPQKLAATRRAAVLIVKIKSDFEIRHQEWLARSDASVPILILCQNGTLETAVQALQYPIFDYFCMDQPHEEILKRIRDALECRLSRALKSLPDPGMGLLHGKSPEIQRINQEAQSLARNSNRPVVLYGEAGTGKEHLAYGMYRLSAAHDLPFVRYDCRLIQQVAHYDGVPVSKFVLTGLRELKKRHNGGMLFLQHLERVQPEQQNEILTAARESSIRLIASCQDNRHVQAEGAEVPTLSIPALRQHPDDIVSLAEYFIGRTAKSRKIRAKTLTQDVVGLMQEYPWPGNVQELSNVMERMMILEPSSILSSNTWRLSHGFGFQWMQEGPSRFSTLIEEVLKSTDGTWDDGAIYDQFMARMKRMLVDLVLPRVDYNQVMAAKLLGISRNTLRDILRQTK